MTSRYLLNRMLMLLPTIFGVVTAVFLLIHFIPGDPVEVMLGETAMPAQKEELRQQLGLDKPVLTQYLNYLSALAVGDFGKSIHTNEPVMKSILNRWPATLQLAISAMIAALIISIPLGVLAAGNRGKAIDRGTLGLSLFGLAMPNFWMGPLLIIFFSINLGWLPVSGRDGLSSLVLPAITLGAGLAAILIRLTRSSMLEVLSEDYIRTAKAKGAAATAIYFRHALWNSLLPVVTVAGMQIGALLSGAVITETIFSWPGIGRLLIEAIEARDYPLVQGCVLNISLCYLFVNLAVDVTYRMLDPRIRLEK